MALKKIVLLLQRAGRDSKSPMTNDATLFPIIECLVRYVFAHSSVCFVSYENIQEWKNNGTSGKVPSPLHIQDIDTCVPSRLCRYKSSSLDSTVYSTCRMMNRNNF